MSEEQGYITLKWGTLKAWRVKDEDVTLIKRYNEIGSELSAMMQNDTPEQKQIICELIDRCNDPRGIFLEWDNKFVSKDEAKKYIMEYGKKK